MKDRRVKTPQTPDDKIAELRAATREANEAIQGLREIMREFNEAKRTLPVLIRGLIDDAANEEMRDYLVKAGEQIRKTTHEAEESIGKRLQRLAQLADSRNLGAPSVSDIIIAQSVIRYITRAADSMDPGPLVEMMAEYRRTKITTDPGPSPGPLLLPPTIH